MGEKVKRSTKFKLYQRVVFKGSNARIFGIVNGCYDIWLLDNTDNRIYNVSESELN
jgi:hypothetical protein